MVEERPRGLGKCSEDHLGSYGYATRPEEPYPFCPQCGKPMVWQCPSCGVAVPDDSDELLKAKFCRQCGANYFSEKPAEPAS
jgi:hypothetical protein